MASPTVETTAASTTSGTSHTPTMPSGIVSGDLLLFFMSIDGSQTVTTDTDYTQIKSILTSGSAARLHISYRQADASANDTPTHSVTSSERATHIVYRISGHENPATQAPEVSTGATGSSSTPNTDTVTPTGGSKDYLFIAAFGQDGALTPPTVNPPSTPGTYTLVEGADSAGGPNNGVNGSTAWKQATAASDNPSFFSFARVDDWAAVTAAVHPESITVPDQFQAYFPDDTRVPDQIVGSGFIPPNKQE